MAYNTLILDPTAADTLVLDPVAGEGADWLVLEVLVAPTTPPGMAGYVWFVPAGANIGFTPECGELNVIPAHGRAGYLPELNVPEYIPAGSRIGYTPERAEQ